MSRILNVLLALRQLFFYFASQFDQQEVCTKSCMVIYGFMIAINCPYKSMACMNVINWPEYGPQYGLLVFEGRPSIL